MMEEWGRRKAATHGGQGRKTKGEREGKKKAEGEGTGERKSKNIAFKATLSVTCYIQLCPIS